MSKCIGTCATHRGRARLVILHHPQLGLDTTPIRYCREAQASDERVGFEVKVLPNEHANGLSFVGTILLLAALLVIATRGI